MVEHAENKPQQTSFDSVFKYEKTINLAQDKVTIATIRKLCIAPDGNFWILDSKQQKIHKFKPDGSYIGSQGGLGQGPGEFIAPFDLYFGKKNMYVLDPRAQKINLFEQNGKFIKFLPILDGRFIQENVNGKLIIAATTFNNPKSGNCLHLYNVDGKLEKSFFPISDIAFKQQFISDSVCFNQDAEGNIYAIQEVAYKIHKYSPDGQLLTSFSSIGTHYILPPNTPPKNKFLQEETKKWLFSWTHVLDVFFHKGLLIVTLSHPKGGAEYAYDIYTADGKFKTGGLMFNNRLLMIDKQGYFYFLKENEDADNNSYYSIVKYSLKGIKP